MGAKLRAQLDNYDNGFDNHESGLDTGTEGGAKQSFEQECDINVILKRFGIGYEIPQGLRVPQSGDFTGINDFHTAMNAIVKARETFESLPAHIRTKFDNDPGKFVDFTTNEENKEQMLDMGLLNQEAAAKVQQQREKRQAAEDAAAAERHQKRQKAPVRGGGDAPGTPPNDN